MTRSGPLVLVVGLLLSQARCAPAPRPSAVASTTTVQTAKLASKLASRDGSSSPSPAPPPSPIRTVTDRYHGLAVRDDYRWLEGDTPEVAAWTASQNAHTRAFLDRLPGRAEVARRVAEVLGARRRRYRDLRIGGDRFFAKVEQPPKRRAFLIAMPAFGDPKDEQTVLDPNALDPSGKTSIDWYRPSPDGRMLAVSLSRAGTESGDLHVVDVETAAIGDVIPRVNGGTAGGDLAWAADGKGFFYTRYPRPDERPPEDLGFYQQLYFHRIGQPSSQDRRQLREDLPRIAEVRVAVDHETERALVSVQLGDGGKFSHFIGKRDRDFRAVAGFEDGIVQVAFGPDGDLFAISRRDAPRGVLLRIDGKTLALDRAKVVLAPEHDTLVSGFWDRRNLLFHRDRFYATFQLGGPSTVRAFDYAGNAVPFDLPFEVASVGSLMSAGPRAMVLRAESFLEPAAYYRYDEAAAKLDKSALADTAPIDMSGYRVTREFAASRDGTKVPVNILLPPGVERDGTNPCVVTGYGGYGYSLAPRFGHGAGLWLERGVIYAIANLRGGGEFGEAWHRAGNLLNKQNVFDDFAAVLEHMAERRYTRRERLGIIGGSNGGLLMGAQLTQHPETYRAIVSFVGIYDMLRHETFPNGAFNVTEYGSTSDPEAFAALYAYSPLHHVVAGTPYPAVLLETGVNDSRVAPWQSRKFAAALQAAGTGDRPILLVTREDAGHGVGASFSQRVGNQALALTFFAHELRR